MNLSRNIGPNLIAEWSPDIQAISLTTPEEDTVWLTDESFHALCRYRAWLQTELASRQAMGETK